MESKLSETLRNREDDFIIEINYRILGELKITADQYLYLYLKYLNKLQEYPASFSSDDFEYLERLDFIKIMSNNTVVLRDKAIEVLSIRAKTSSVESWIQEWIDLWPNGVKIAGRPVKGGKTSILKKMKSFVLNHKHFTKEQIIEATKYYLEDRKRDHWNYIMMAEYFINKNGTSNLESCIENLNQREYEFKKNYDGI